MINVITSILVLAIFVGAIVVGAIATVLDKRINVLQGEIHRNERYAETQLMSMESEIDKADEVKTLVDLAMGKADSANSELVFVVDKIEAIDRELRGETYAIEFWSGDCYGGFKKNGDPSYVSHSEAVIMTRHEADRIKKKLGIGEIVNRSKTILKNLEDK